MTNAIEKMNVEELDIVTGGNIGKTASDSRFFHDLGCTDLEFDTTHLTFHWDSGSSLIRYLWSTVGITCDTSVALSNEYYYKGKEISRMQALIIAMQATGKTLDVSKYEKYAY